MLRVTPLAALASDPQVLAGDRRRQRTPGRVQQVKRYRLLPAAWTAETESLRHRASQGGQQPQSHLKGVGGLYGAGPDEIHDGVAVKVCEALQQFSITGVLALEVVGEGADERVGGDPAVQAGDDAVEHRGHHAEDLGERVRSYRRPDPVHQRAPAQ